MQNKTRWGVYKKNTPYVIEINNKEYEFGSVVKLRRFNKLIEKKLTMLLLKFNIELKDSSKEILKGMIADSIYGEINL